MPIKATPLPVDAASAVLQKIAERSRVQQSIQAGPKSLQPSIFYAKTAAQTAFKPTQADRVKGEPSSADIFGASDDAKLLIASQSLVGSSADPSEHTKSQLFEVGHKKDADVVIPAPQTTTQPITRAQTKALLTRIAKIRYGSHDSAQAAAAQRPQPQSTTRALAEAATSARPAAGNQRQPTIKTTTTQAAAESANAAPRTFVAATSPSAPLLASAPLRAGAMPNAAANRGAQGPQVQLAKLATLGAGAAAVAPAAATQNDSAPSSQPPADFAGPQSPATARLVGQASGAQSSSAPSSSAGPSATQSATQPPPTKSVSSTNSSASATDALLAKAVKAGNASIGATSLLSDAAFNENLSKAWADVEQAGARRQNAGPVNWQAFFNLLAAKNAKLLEEFIELQKQATLLESQISIVSLKLDKDITATDQSFARAQALLGLARNVYSLQDSAVKSANPILFNESPYLTPNELQLQSGLGNRQMRSPIQRTYQNSFVHQLAGDTAHKTCLLSGDTRESYMNTFRTQKYVEIAQRNPQWTPEQIHQEATAHYASRPVSNSAELKTKILTSYTKIQTLPSGETKSTQEPINRNMLTDEEKSGLLGADKEQYDRMMYRVRETLYTDLPGQAEMYLAEIQSLQSAAARASVDAEKQALLEKSASFKVKYDDVMKNIRGAADVMGSSERGYNDAMRIRGDLEGIRRGADRELTKLKATLAGGNQNPSTQLSGAEKEKLQAQILVYESMTNSINRKCSIIDDNLLRHFDSRVDNRRGRFKTGADGVVRENRAALMQIRDAQAKLAKLTDDSDSHEKRDLLAKLQTAAEQKARLETYPAFFKNPVKLHEALLERICAHRADGAISFDDNPELFRQFEATVQQPMRAAGSGGLSLEAVSKTRMLAHIKERGEELVNQPADNPEKQALSAMDAFWRHTTLWPDGGGYAPPQPIPGGLGLKNKVVAAVTNIKLRSERAAAKDTEDPEKILNLPTVRHWHKPDGSLDREVNFNDVDETNRYYSAVATVGGNILGLQNEVKDNAEGKKGSGGAYRDRLGHRIDHFRTFLNNFSMNLGNVDTLVNSASESATNLSSDAQESLSEFTSLMAQARQQTEGLITQLYDLANAKVGR